MKGLRYAGKLLWTKIFCENKMKIMKPDRLQSL